MKFEFSKHDRVLALHHFDKNGEYTLTKTWTIHAHTGLPAKSTLKPLPQLNDNERAYFINDDWVKTEFFIGRKYYDEYAHELVINEFPFVLPDGHSFEKPLPKKDGYYVKLVNNQWVYLTDNIDKTAYSKLDDNDFIIESNGELPDTHTLIERKAFSVWNEQSNDWIYQKELERPIKIIQEREWRDNQLNIVLSRIDQYEKDKNYPVELQTSLLSESQFLELLNDRKLLCDYPQQQGFPFCERPTLNGAYFINA
ncbi:hypothetical protein AAFX60_006910 [Aliivibrio fischeri]